MIFTDFNKINKPKILSEIENKSNEIGFKMPSDIHIGSLLKILISSKPKSTLLELGTGIGLSLSWMIDGMDSESKIISIDNDFKLIEIVKEFFGKDKRVELICIDGTKWVKDNINKKFDLIFADTWAGKYNELDEVLDMVKVGGFYIIDDMLPQPNWPDGHEEKSLKLIEYLENRKDFVFTKINWGSGIMIGTKRMTHFTHNV